MRKKQFTEDMIEFIIVIKDSSKWGITDHALSRCVSREMAVDIQDAKNFITTTLNNSMVSVFNHGSIYHAYSRVRNIVLVIDSSTKKVITVYKASIKNRLSGELNRKNHVFLQL